MSDPQAVVSVFYSPRLHRQRSSSTYVFGDSAPQLGNVVSKLSAAPRERIVNIWWKGAADQVLQEVHRQYPDATLQGTITADGSLLLPRRQNGQRESRALFAEALSAALDGNSTEGLGEVLSMLGAGSTKPLPPRGERLPEFTENGPIPRTSSDAQPQVINAGIVGDTMPTNDRRPPPKGRPVFQVIPGGRS